MGYLKTIERKVRTILAKNEDARNDDMVLYLVLCNACLKDAGALPLAEIMTQYKYLGLQHIITKGTIDERIMKALSEKDTTQAALIEAVKADLKI